MESFDIEIQRFYRFGTAALKTLKTTKTNIKSLIDPFDAEVEKNLDLKSKISNVDSEEIQELVNELKSSSNVKERKNPVKVINLQDPAKMYALYYKSCSGTKLLTKMVSRFVAAMNNRLRLSIKTLMDIVYPEEMAALAKAKKTNKAASQAPVAHGLLAAPTTHGDSGVQQRSILVLNGLPKKTVTTSPDDSSSSVYMSRRSSNTGATTMNDAKRGILCTSCC